MNPELPTALRRAERALRALDPAALPPAAVRALDRLERDLLPRTADEGPYLVAGIVGPNNAGKSALFNALAGRPLSPSKPTGGCTRRLIGVLHPELLARLQAEPTLSRFPLVPWSDGPGPAEVVTQPAERAHELLVAASEDLPGGLLLIDTPDFDSILADNRLASESLLAVADLAICVVTRHSYQNREVVEYLRAWLSHGRPWLLVYNEAFDTEIVIEHARKLARDLGSEPQGVFAAPLDLDVQRGGGVLAPTSVGLGDVPVERGLREHLFDLREVGELKARALEASLAQLREDLGQLARHLAAESDLARGVAATARARADELARGIASTAMPGGPFIEAFRTVLDRRSHALMRGFRAGLRRVRSGIERLPALWRRSARAGGGASAREQLAAIEVAELERRWGAFWEALSRDLGPEQRDPGRRRLSPRWGELLDADLGPERGGEALERARAALAECAVEMEAFRTACEELVERAIDERGYEWDIQAGANVAMIAPLALAAAIIIKTGGLGADIGAAGGGALTSYLTEKYSHLLGSRITREASERWSALRAETLAPRLMAAALPGAGPALVRARDEEAARARELEAVSREVV